MLGEHSDINAFRETDVSPKFKVKFILFLLRTVENRLYFLLLTCLVASSFYASMMADDYYLAIRMFDKDLLPSINDASLWNMFSVSDGHSVTNQYLVQHGLLPWWTSEAFRFQMWRPLAEVSHWIDFRLWPKSLVAMHVHQMAWVFAFFALSYRFLLKFNVKAEIGILAFIIFSLSANHGQTIAWLASRNTLMAATFGISAVLFHAHSVESGKSSFRIFAILSFVAAILSSEFGLSAGAWIFAWTLILDRNTLKTRLVRLIPYGVIMLLWALIYSHWNHGVFSSEFYIDPASYPVKYLGALLEKAPTILFNSKFHIPAGIFGSGELGKMGWCISLLFTGLFVYAIRSEMREPLTRFFLCGSVLSMLPIAAGAGGSRTLAFVSLGITPIIARLLYLWAFHQINNQFRAYAVNIVVWPVIVLTIISIGVIPTVSAIYRDHNIKNYALPASKLPITEEDFNKTVVLINPNSVFYAIFYPLVRSYQGLDQPSSFYSLASSKNRAMNFLRDSTQSFVLTPENGFLIDPAAYFTRSQNEKFEEGQIIKYPDISIEIVSMMGDGRPASIRVKFDVALDSESLKIVGCDDQEFYLLDIPITGHSKTIPACET